MIWLIEFLVRKSWEAVLWTVFGPPRHWPKKRKKQEPTPAEIPTGDRPAFQRFTYGSMTVRVWRNWNARGELYFNLDFVRQVEKGRTARSFRPQDLDDVERCLYKVRAWLREAQ